MSQKQAKIVWTDRLTAISQNSKHIEFTGGSSAVWAWLLCQLAELQKRPFLVVAPDRQSAETLFDELRFFAGALASSVLSFPAYNVLPYKPLGYHRQTVAKRIDTLYRMIENSGPGLVVTSIEALVQRILPRASLVEYTDIVMEGESIDRDGLVTKLLEGGYHRTVLVEEPGDLSVRGGIIDLFPPGFDHPVRIELFGDMVESIRLFSAATQRSQSSIAELVILPASEAIITRADQDAILTRLRLQAVEQELAVTKTRQWVEDIKTAGGHDLLEPVLPIVYSETATLLDYLPQNACLVEVAPAAGDRTFDDLLKLIDQSYAAALSAEQLCVAPEQLYLNKKTFRGCLEPFDSVVIKPLAIEAAGEIKQPQTVSVPLNIRDTSRLKLRLAEKRAQKPLTYLIQWIERQLDRGLTTLFVCQSDRQRQRLARMLMEYGLAAATVDTMAQVEPGTGQLVLITGTVSAGFIWPDAGLAVVPDHELFARKATRTALQEPSRRRETTLVLEELQIGSLVVHEDHGIGRYQGLVKLSVEKATGDYLNIEYKDADRLYLPVDRMDQVQKYMGMDDTAPVLDKMGGKSWERIKSKVKRSAEMIAGELLKIYATRKIQTGIQYDDPGPGFEPFLQDFMHEETRDQRKAIADVQKDMADTKPMDRLICGDVGYGKTEVALRAAYIAVSHGKQVTVVVPTTVLAEQHYATFTERFEKTPFNVGCLSRFRSKRHQKASLEKLGSGRLDIVVGTHRLFSKDVVFSDLGLVVLDEEQRFGVRHKEQLKKLRATVDVLALTATPIPRTLHLSLTGIRDISIISTPPELRRPIITYISEFQDSIILDAVSRELARDGQVYFVHNHVATIGKMATHLQKLFPAAKIDVAHGQMDETQLEEAMYRFGNHAVDILVCTTIIESGIDVANANTMLINHADRFGLTQMYQLRGRVGRSAAQAYAYLFIPKESTLTRDAQKRLKVLMEHSDLGSGFQVAMNDLKIRGGGTILGANQSGHVAAVGYDMFLKLMRQAVAEQKGEPLTIPIEPEINIPLAAFIPGDYVPDIDQRLAIYRRLAGMESPADISRIKLELIDRFGPLPEEMTHLLIKMLFRVYSLGSGILKVDLTDNWLILKFSPEHVPSRTLLTQWVERNMKTADFTRNWLITLPMEIKRLSSKLGATKKILKEIYGHVTS